MIRFLIIMVILLNFAEASSEKYFIQFGSFKNLKGLEKSILKLPSSLRTHVVIVRSNGWYIPFAYYTPSRNLLYSKVASYKHYFPDAHIAHSAYMLNHPLVHNYALKKIVPKKIVYRQPVQYKYPKKTVIQPQYQNLPIANTTPLAPIVNSTPIVQMKVVKRVEDTQDVFKNQEPIRYKNFSKKMLSGKHYYLAYKTSDEKPNLLIKVSFGNHDVTYQPVIGEMTMMKANYLIEHSRLYMFTDTFTRNGAFSKLEEHRKNHFLVSSWADGKKLNTLRYYYKLNDAKKYLGISTSDGLAETLQEGDYDDFFLEEDDY